VDTLVTLSGYVQILKERWKLVLAGLLLGIAVAGLVTWTATPQYAANVIFFVSAQDPEGDAAVAYQGNLMSQQKVKSYTQLLTGARIRQDIERSGKATIGSSVISAVAKPDTVLLTATVTDPSAQRAKEIADVVAEVFPGLVAELERPANGGPANVIVRVVESAALPVSPVSPEPLTNGILGTLLGLLAGVTAALIRNVADNSVKSVDVLAEVVDAPVLGSVGLVSDGATRPLIVHDQAGSPRAEACRQIRTNLQFVNVDQPPRVVVFTSSLPREGKTTTACNVAITLAQAGLKVVLVDADLRRPTIAEYLGLEGAVGLTSVLIDSATLDQALQPWGSDGMTVLASGPIPPNPSELLASQHMTDVLGELAGRCDMVLVDTPPLLPVTDAAVLASRCDGALLVIRHGKTTKNQVRAAGAALRAVSARLLGTVLTMTPRTRSGRSYGYYQYSYESSSGRAAANGNGDPSARPRSGGRWPSGWRALLASWIVSWRRKPDRVLTEERHQASVVGTKPIAARDAE
jgi:capsular exopolysaccharide synthesis family protein